MSYDHRNIEKKWQKEWDTSGINRAPEHPARDKKMYVLPQLPYPSGEGLHVGHVEGYAACDIVARYNRMRGREILQAIGWDAFGLPAENFAIKTNVHPRVNTNRAIDNFRKQIKALGLSVDWSREVGSHNPDYYKWTQWFFLLLYQRGLAYRKEQAVNWCEACKTTLANEQVEDGACERCGGEVIQKEMEQWFFKITDYAQRLHDDLDKVDWPAETVKRQRDWIGRSEGAEVSFPLFASAARTRADGTRNDADAERLGEVKVFTTRADTLFGATYLVLAPEHPLVEELASHIENLDEVRAYTDATRKKSDLARQTEKDLPAPRPGKFFVYAILCKNDSIYIGQTNDLDKRWKMHTSGLVKHTKKYPPRQIIHFEIFDSREEAVKREKDLKTGFGRKWLRREWKAGRTRQAGKTGVELKGVSATNPANGERIPVWIADYVLLHYGTGAIMAVPAHDERDYEFAKKFGLPIREVVAKLIGEYIGEKNRRDVVKAIVEKKGQVLLIQEETGLFLPGGSYESGGTDFDTLKREMVEETGYTEFSIGEYLGRIDFGGPAPEEKGMRRVAAYRVDLGDQELKTYHNKEEDETSVWLPIDEAIAKSREGMFIERARSKFGAVYTGGGLLINSGEFDGMDSETAKKKIVEKVGGVEKTTFKLRDWLVSRQRFWGAPIPIVYDPGGEPHPVDEKDLPVLLPDDVDFKPTGQSPLTYSDDFQKGVAEKYGEGWRREVDTLDTFVCSSWYYYRYLDPNNERAFASPKALKDWTPVDFYIGGAEHVNGHLLYSRFFTKVLFDEELIDFDEPFLTHRHQGIILGEDNRKMSKRWGNVVNPTDMVERFGADTLRLYEMFIGPLEQTKAWDMNGMVGVRRFLEKVWGLREKISDDSNKKSKADGLEKTLHKTVKKVGEDIGTLSFNTAVAKMMEFVNAARDAGSVPRGAWEVFLKILAPFAPHIAEELWSELGHTTSIHLEKWPAYDPALVEDDEVTIVVQVNGKTRGEFRATKGLAQSELEQRALALPAAQKWLAGKTPRKTIVVAGKLVNIVV